MIKPILFNTEMVRAILDGRKTVTRRIVKPNQMIGLKPDKCEKGVANELIREKPLLFKPYCDMTDSELVQSCYYSPYLPGDTLWVRETWNHYKHTNLSSEEHREGYFYKASPEMKITLPDYVQYHWGRKWMPSIHMPKEAARIFLKVIEVRVERLQDMCSIDCLKEGIEAEYPHVLNGEEKRYAFSQLWDSSIKKDDIDIYGWDANPWVWVIEFERCEKPADWSVEE